MERPRVYINHVAEFDWLIALEFGRVDDAQPPENWRGVSDEFGYLHDSPDGRAVGFKVIDYSEVDVDAATPRYHHAYLELDGWEYWTMGAPVTETTVINRARVT